MNSSLTSIMSGRFGPLCVAVVVVRLGDERGERCGDRFPDRVPVAEAPRYVSGLQCDGCPRWAADLIRNASSPRALPEAN